MLSSHPRLGASAGFGGWGQLHSMAADPTLLTTSALLSPRFPCQLPSDPVLSLEQTMLSLALLEPSPGPVQCFTPKYLVNAHG